MEIVWQGRREVVKQQKVAKEKVDEEKVIYRGEKIYYEVSVGNKDYESLKLNTEVVGKDYRTEMVSKTTPPTRWMWWRDVRPGWFRGIQWRCSTCTTRCTKTGRSSFSST